MSAPESLAPTRTIGITRVGADGTHRTTDLAATEEPLDVRLHGRSFALIMRTPGADRALAAGFLLSERIIRSADDLGAIEHCRHPDRREAHHVVDVFLRGRSAEEVTRTLEARRQVIANSACGVCGRATIDELLAELTPLAIAPSMIDVAVARELPDRLRATQSGFDETGGLHGAALFDRDAVLLESAEDVGRHNAVDKVIGARIVAELDASGLRTPRCEPRVLVVSGRVSFEIVQKAWIAGMPIIAAVSAPTSLAVELARDAGITLLGFVRGRGLNIYSHEQRLAGV